MKMESAVTLAGTIGSFTVIWICAFCATPLELFAGTTVAVGAVVSGVAEGLVPNVVEKSAMRLPDRSRSPVSCTLYVVEDARLAAGVNVTVTMFAPLTTVSAKDSEPATGGDIC